MANIEVGQEAPDFTLRDENNQTVRLSELRGTAVVLVFYPLDFSPVCTTEMCALRDDYVHFEARGAKVFGISRDSVYAHKAFKDSLGLTYSLLADMKGEVARLYGCWNEALGLSERLTVVVGSDGVIRYVTRSEILKPRDHREALAALG